MNVAAADLAGRVALVTGGSRGIGAATAALLGYHGAAVGVGGRDREAIARVAGQIRADGGQAVAVPADCTDPGALADGYRVPGEAFGPAELLAAFAGGGGQPRPTEQVSPDEWRRVIDGDLTATFLTIRAALPAMLERRRGAIETMSSSAGRQPGQAAAAYAAAKAGVAMLSRHLAAEFGSRGIRVNCLAPSAVVTERMAAHMTGQQRAQLAKAFPLGRLGQPATSPPSPCSCSPTPPPGSPASRSTSAAGASSFNTPAATASSSGHDRYLALANGTRRWPVMPHHGGPDGTWREQAHIRTAEGCAAGFS